MLAYVDRRGDPVPWQGQPVYGLYHPADVEIKWTDDELNYNGLYRIMPFQPRDDEIIIPNSRTYYYFVGNYVVEQRETMPVY